jgi:hypothetical protein
LIISLFLRNSSSIPVLKELALLARAGTIGE